MLIGNDIREVQVEQDFSNTYTLEIVAFVVAFVAILAIIYVLALAN